VQHADVSVVISAAFDKGGWQRKILMAHSTASRQHNSSLQCKPRE